MDNMLALHDWQNFYMLTGTAAATLIGLLFVAISIGSNLARQQVTNALQTFVTPTLLSYFQVLLVSCLAVMPLQSPLILGGALAILGCINIVLALQVFWRLRVIHSEVTEPGHWIWHFWLPLAAGFLFVGSATAFLLGEPFALLGISITNLLCLSTGLRNTWVTTVWLALNRVQEHQPADISASQEEKMG